MSMYKIFGTTLLVSLFLAPFLITHAALLGSNTTQKDTTTETDVWLLTYYVGYQNGTLKPKDVDFSLMTHVVVGGVGVQADGTLDEHWHLPNGDGRKMALEIC
ncbi:MAG: Glycoside hydrolase family 18 [Parcubacteria group bacterium GW2011_GWA2_43_11]|nr:MAG: Glycoside hydrolase family 18 [Parcubacteria group bacterium GW2011_GWA2_43_11]